jgi:gliding motility-associated-like protein
MKRIFFLFSFGLLIHLSAQQVGSIEQAVIGSSGNYSTNGNLTISSTVGECIVPTVANGPIILTQGFQQPSATSVLALQSTIVYYNATCLGANDGVATMTVIGGSAPYTYIWSTGPNDSLASVDSLAPGTYTVTIVDAGNLSQTQTFTIFDGTNICDIYVYKGFTPNGDGQNDLWIIDYLELHQPNTVEIYSRWGELVWEGTNYDNVNVVWDGHSKDGDELPDGTYYWIITEGNATMKGWVELTH